MARRTAQLSLDLRPRLCWGGARKGAGRKPGAVRRDPHRRRAPLSRAHPCHVTLKVRREVPSLRSARLVRAFESSLRASCERGRFRVAHYSIQSDHVHAARGPQRDRLRPAHARRHRAKLGRRIDARGRIDPASSGRWFGGWKRSPPTMAGDPPVATPRTWLLRAGWRRHGLVDISEIPGVARCARVRT
jgi:hypothetical protein